MAEALSVMPDEIVVEEPASQEDEHLEAGSDDLEVPEPEGEPEPEPAPKPEPGVEEMRRVARLLEEDLAERRGKKEPGAPAKAKPGEEEITEEQLVKVIDQYKDNPAVLLQVFKHVAKETAKSIRDETVQEERVRTWSDQTRSTALNIVKDEFGKLQPAEQAYVKETLPSLIENLGLGNHPAGPLAAFAIVRMAQLSEKPAKVEAPESGGKPKGQVDKTRRAPGKAEGEGRLTAEDREVMTALGVKDPKLYLKYKAQGV